MTCLQQAHTLGEAADVVRACALAYGGPAWQQLSLMGLASLALMGVGVLGLVALARAAAAR